MSGALVRTATLACKRSIADLESLLSRDAREDSVLTVDVSQLPDGDAVKEAINGLRLAADPFVLREARYSLQIVRLYGALEMFCEGLIQGTVDALGEIADVYAGLPAELRDSHRRKSLDALRDEIWLSRQSDSRVSQDLIANLHSCENEGKFKLNTSVYARHSANYRRRSLDEAFRFVGIPNFCQLVQQEQGLLKFLTGLALPRPDFADLSAVDDLAERRNEVAHGAPSSIQGTDELVELVSFIRCFVDGCFEVARQHLVGWLVRRWGIHISEIQQVHHKQVACMKLDNLTEGQRLGVGDIVATRQAKSRFSIGYIANLRTDVGDVSEVRAGLGRHVCIETTFRLKAGEDLLFLPDTAPALWLAQPRPTAS